MMLLFRRHQTDRSSSSSAAYSRRPRLFSLFFFIIISIAMVAVVQGFHPQAASPLALRGPWSLTSLSRSSSSIGGGLTSSTTTTTTAGFRRHCHHLSFRSIAGASTTRIMHGGGGAEHAAHGGLEAAMHTLKHAFNSIPLLGELLSASSGFWAALIMLSIVSLLYVWETAVKSARQTLPPTLMPVIDSMLAEMGGLGFIGLFLSVAVTDGFMGDIVAAVSEEFLGDEEILLESFEYLHTAFFEVGIGFFVIAGITVARVLEKIESFAEVTAASFDTDGDGKVSCKELADALQVCTVPVDINKDGDLSTDEIHNALIRVAAAKPTNFIEEATASSTYVKAEALVVRQRFIEQGKVSEQHFRIDEYYAKVFGHNLKEMVELSPLTWLPLVPAIALHQTVDMSRDIVSASSPNAALSCGYFLGTPGSLIASAMVCLISVLWGWWNFYKVTSIKEMLLPTLVRDSQANGKAYLLPPRYEVDELMAAHEKKMASPWFALMNSLESFFAGTEHPARNRHEALFGNAGAAGPELYCNSIKIHTWVAVSQIVLYGSQVVGRDIEALWQGNMVNVGAPDLLIPELIVFGSFVAIAMAQLWLVPQTFLNHCLVTSVETMVQEHILYEANRELDIDKLIEERDRNSNNNSPNGSTMITNTATTSAELPVLGWK